VFLARKITLSKWKRHPALAAGEISADCVTSDLRTKRLTLSFWECSSADDADLDNVVLALASTILTSTVFFDHPTVSP